jgi:hypothetical protein
MPRPRSTATGAVTFARPESPDHRPVTTSLDDRLTIVSLWPGATGKEYGMATSTPTNQTEVDRLLPIRQQRLLKVVHVAAARRCELRHR